MRWMSLLQVKTIIQRFSEELEICLRSCLQILSKRDAFPIANRDPIISRCWCIGCKLSRPPFTQHRAVAYENRRYGERQLLVEESHSVIKEKVVNARDADVRSYKIAASDAGIKR